MNIPCLYPRWRGILTDESTLNRHSMSVALTTFRGEISSFRAQENDRKIRMMGWKLNTTKVIMVTILIMVIMVYNGYNGLL